MLARMRRKAEDTRGFLVIDVRLTNDLEDEARTAYAAAETAHKGELVGGAVQVVVGPLGFEVHVAGQKVGQEPQPNLEGDDVAAQREMADLCFVEKRPRGRQVASRGRR